MRKKLTMQMLIIAAEGGNLYRYDFLHDRLQLLFEEKNKETLMGLARVGQHLFVGAKTKVYRFNFNQHDLSGDFKCSEEFLKRVFSKSKREAGFHQMSVVNGHFYITATGFNEILKMDLDLNLVKAFKIKPPRRFFPIRYKWNYNHLNNIFFHNDHFYVCLNWLTSSQYGPSGVAVLDKNLKEVERFEYGWETHNFSIINGKRFVLLGSSGAIKPIGHIHKAGLMVDGEIVFEHSPDKFFCKDFSVDDNYIYIVGGSVNTREQRNEGEGVVFVLDRNYSLLEKKTFPDSGGFCGCLTENHDLTKT